MRWFNPIILCQEIIRKEFIIEKPRIYSKEHCVQCTATKRAFDSEGIEYDELMLELLPEKVEEFRSEGLLQAPVVEANGERWSGFQPDKIKALGALAMNTPPSYE